MGVLKHQRGEAEARTAISAAFEVFMQAGHEQYRDDFEDRLREIDKQITALQAQQ